MKDNHETNHRVSEALPIVSLVHDTALKHYDVFTEDFNLGLIMAITYVIHTKPNDRDWAELDRLTDIRLVQALITDAFMLGVAYGIDPEGTRALAAFMKEPVKE